MERLFVKSIIVFFAIAASLTAFAQQKKVAVLNPICRDNSVSSIYFSVVRGSFESVASATDGFEVYNRADLDAIASEMKFQQSGAVDDAETRKIGMMAGVDFVLVTVLSSDEGYLMVESKILNVESSQYDRAASKLMNMTPPVVEKTCFELAQSLFKINMSSGIQKGEIIYNGYRYIGEYKNKKPNGRGKIYYDANELFFYEGNFSDGMRSGYGKMNFESGSRYEGNWESDRMNGQGILYFSNGGKMEGVFQNDDFKEGTMYYTNGDMYVGQVRNGDPNGRGTMYYTSGDKYVGEWSNGVFSGYGIYTESEGDVYEGNFTEGEKNGEGTYKTMGHTFIGTWKMGEMDGLFYVFLSDGSSFSCEIVNGEMTNIKKLAIDEKYIHRAK